MSLPILLDLFQGFMSELCVEMRILVSCSNSVAVLLTVL